MRFQCLDALAMISVTGLHVAPNRNIFIGFRWSMSKNAFKPTPGLH